MFLDGLTVEDLAVLKTDGQLVMSHVAARAELRSLMQVLGLPETKAAWMASAAEPLSRAYQSPNMSHAPG